MVYNKQVNSSRKRLKEAEHRITSVESKIESTCNLFMSTWPFKEQVTCVCKTESFCIYLESTPPPVHKCLLVSMQTLQKLKTKCLQLERGFRGKGASSFLFTNVYE